MILSQRTMPWGNELLGFSNLYIHATGCFITVLAEILETTPDDVNNKLKAVNGFAPDVNKQLSEVIWAKVAEAFPGVSCNMVTPYDNDAVLNELNLGASVIVEVPAAPIGGTGIHAVRYMGGGLLHDPWTGTERPTSDFPNPISYVVVTKQSVATPEAVTPVVETPAPVASTYKGLDLTNVDSVKAAIDAWDDVANNGVYVRKSDVDANRVRLTSVLGIDPSSNDEVVLEHVTALKTEFNKQAFASVIPTPGQVAGVGPASTPVTPAVTMKNLPAHEKETLMNHFLGFEAGVKELLGLNK